MLGRRIGTYEVVSKLGEGGMGIVYLARHSVLGRLAALKVLLPEYSHQREIVGRFFNEARAATAIRHPGIVDVYDFGFTEEQQAFIVMEFLEGQSLASRLRRGPLAFPALLAIARGIARALHAAHEKGIVHRDLKPDNVFLVPDEDLPGGERVKLLDFGIAKLTVNANETGHTRTGMVIGTPTYMAPEQCRGTGQIDFRADLYALGCVMYQMASGRPPFVAEAAADLLAHHLYFEPQRVSELRSEVPTAIEQLVTALLVKDPERRPASANAVVRAIDAIAEGAFTATPLPASTRALSAPPISVTPSKVATASSLDAPPNAAPPGIATSRIGMSSLEITEPRTAIATSPVSTDATTLSGAVGTMQVPRARYRRSLVIALSAIVGAVIVTAIMAMIDSSAQRETAGDPVASLSMGSTPAPASAAATAPGPVYTQNTAADSAANAEPTQAPLDPAEPVALPPDPVSSVDGASGVTPEPGSRPTISAPVATGDKLKRSSSSSRRNRSNKGADEASSAKPELSLDNGEEVSTPMPERFRSSETTKPTEPEFPQDKGEEAPNSAARCSRASFQVVLNEPSPSEATIQAALGRLRQCKASLGDAEYAELQQQLVARF